MSTTLKGMLFDADYIDVEGRAWIRLWVKTEGGETVVLYDNSFEPYFYVTLEDESSMEDLKKEISKVPGVVRVEEVEKKDYGKPIKTLRVVVNFPKSVPRIRGIIGEIPGVREVREADIPFAIRYLIDKGLRPMDGIEAEVEEKKVEDLPYKMYLAREVRHYELEEMLPLKIMAFDIEVSNPQISVDPERDNIIMISVATGPNPEDAQVMVLENSEGVLIKKFVSFVREYDPDIILTYNGNEFDWPYIKKRAEKHGIPINIGRDGGNLYIRPAGARREARATGRALVDLYEIVERDLPDVKIKTLKNIAEYLGVMMVSERTMIKGREIYKYWKDPEKRKILEKYSLDDARATYLVGMELLPLQYEMSKLIRQPLSRTYCMSRGRQVDWYLVAEAYHMNELAPNKAEVEEETIYEGAIVLEPKKGLYTDVLYLDFGSMYPTIMITYNISPETYIPPDVELPPDQYYQAPEVGHRFRKSPDGFYRKILRELIERRKKIKKLLKQLDKNSKEYKLFNIRQLALKTLANSFYGYTGWLGARWYKRECAEATTAWGRYFIRKVKEKAESYGIEVLYGDTDSIFVKNHPKVMEFLEEVNRELPLELEIEARFIRILFTGVKKRYAGLTEKGELMVRGLEVRRGDWCELAKEVQAKVIEIVLKEGDVEKAKNYVKDIIKKLREGKIEEEELEKLVIYKTITRNIDEYVSQQAHVAAVKRAIQHGFRYRPGMKVGILIIRSGGEKLADKAIVVDMYDPNKHQIDVDYYVEKQIIPAAIRVLSVFGVTEEELKSGKQQSTLDMWLKRSLPNL